MQVLGVSESYIKAVVYCGFYDCANLEEDLISIIGVQATMR
jgi:hypothetical protein